LGVPINADPEPTKLYLKRSVTQIFAKPNNNNNSTSIYKGTTKPTPRKRNKKLLITRESPATDKNDAGEFVNTSEGGRNAVKKIKIKQTTQNAVKPY